MVVVTLELEAAEQLDRLPERIKSRVTGIIKRLGNWPEVSGAKTLQGEFAKHYRIRTGDYRLQFRVTGDEVIIERMGHRDRFYE